MKRQKVSTQEIRAILVQYHEKEGYEIFPSFPLVSNDTTVMFVNATITPFKHWFVDSSKKMGNYALIQNCFRMGGASEIGSVGVNPYYHTFFEMFGSGTFDASHKEAVRYLLQLLKVLGLDRQRLYFTVPKNHKFQESLVANGVNSSKIFTLERNDVFWQKWQFGKFGLLGKGLTVIYSRSQARVFSVKQMAIDPLHFIEILNLIYVYGREAKEGEIVTIPNPGFDLGIGLERLVAVLQGCNNYQIDSINLLVQIVNIFFRNRGDNLDKGLVRILTDHLRAICVLVNEGIRPSNKKHGYVLRKLIRRYIELVWISTNRVIATETLVKKFCGKLEQYGGNRILSSTAVDVTDVIKKEEQALYRIVQKAKHVMGQQPNIPPDVLKDTYGLSPELIKIFF